MTERTDILELMARLKLYGMRAAYDEVMTTGIKRRHEPPRIVGDLLSAEIAEKQARSIKYQLTIAKLPLAKDIGNFDFTGTPINEALIRALAAAAVSNQDDKLRELLSQSGITINAAGEAVPSARAPAEQSQPAAAGKAP